MSRDIHMVEFVMEAGKDDYGQPVFVAASTTMIDRPEFYGSCFKRLLQEVLVRGGDLSKAKLDTYVVYREENGRPGQPVKCTPGVRITPTMLAAIKRKEQKAFKKLIAT